MHEATRSKVLQQILKPAEDEVTPYAKERQHAAQAFTLQVEWKDGRRSEGFPWMHYSGCAWRDQGDGLERLIVLFGARALEIEGRNLGPLVGDVREGKLNLVREMSTSRQALLSSENPDEPIISAIYAYPQIEDILNDIKGENDDQRRHARRT